MKDALPLYKSYLFSVAYNILGQIQEAEDVVQDCFEDILSTPDREVQNEKAYLTRVVANKSIDRLKKLKKEREQYPGTWLPEPYLQTELPAADEEKTDILSYGLMSLIEQLNPVERAVFVLREAFDYSYASLAEIVQTSETNCRKILSRARVKLRSEPLRQTNGKSHRELLDAFLRAHQQGDIKSLASLLKKDVIIYSDGGGKASAALKPVTGADNVMQLLEAISGMESVQAQTVQILRVNGRLGLVFFSGQKPETIFCFEVDKMAFSKMYIIRNPDKMKVSY
ncbi:sigma-70 family RNA polymerase sigma factor [Dyadobacter aurulentus]|uniref:sigma-70 family RNA polymerase sigma factor n=1 Tax=Dyadobacter sp. UC 10 TaxID=2605428 RepID=UPI0011F29D25|nr:sigma-70 family RNA polymerase sigma factor [Dyadobacter sp. UC 10]KAA0992272.1 sigma-70 family RNA polymerase sigma factor [Dyadobacter sp. UC 10]